jgi:hypothetical protein
VNALTITSTADAELLRRMIARMTPERRNVALVKYDREFALWQFSQDPLAQALKNLRRQITSQFKDV